MNTLTLVNKPILRSTTYDERGLKMAMELLMPKEVVLELRIPKLKQGRGVTSGYFDNPTALIKAAMQYSGKADGVYVTLNPVKPELLARSSNRIKQYAEQTTGDDGISTRCWLPLDFDPKRPSGISSTDEEHEAALQRAINCRRYLKEQGWPEPVLADSGNGAHLLYFIDLPNEQQSTVIVQKCLEAIAFRFSDEIVDVDLKTFNAARIWKLYGTQACKGDNVSERPHRLAMILEGPDLIQPVSLEKLNELASMAPSSLPISSVTQNASNKSGKFNLDEWIAKMKIEILKHGPWSNGGRKWILKHCPWNSEHNQGAAYIVQHPSGAIAAGCQHNGCSNNDWHALRDKFEPGWRGNREGLLSHMSLMSHPNEETQLLITEWPKPLQEAAYHGLAGSIVRAIAPHTEADEVALLIQLLVGFANAIRRIPYALADGARHYLNLFTVLIGSTSKGRKGTSWQHVKNLLEHIDPEWIQGQIASGLSSGEGLIWAVRDPISKREPIRDKTTKIITHYQDVEVDAGVLDKRLLVQESEFATILRVLERDGSTLSATIRQAWDTGTLRVLNKNSPAKATDAYISIIGHITKDELRRYINATEAANGFGNRFLWLCVRRSKSLPRGGKIHEVDFKLHIKKLTTALEFARNIEEIKFDKNADALWCEIYSDLSEGKAGMVGAMTSRGEAQVLRLSCIYALLDGSAVIGVVHLKAALAIWKYCEESAHYVFGDALGDPVADELLKALRTHPEGMTRTEIRDYFQRHQRANQIDRALTLLIEQHLIRRIKEETDGRPIERWFAVHRECDKSDQSPSTQ